MVKFLARRLVALVAVVVMVTVVTWISIHGLRPEAFAHDRRPTLEQLGDYLADAFLRFELGTSWENNRPPVAGMLREGLPADLWLLAGGMAFGLLLGMAAGAYVGWRPRAPVSRAIASMREVLHEEFVRTALSKGISNRRMLRRHAAPAAAAPVLTLAGVSVPVMVTNMVLVELTFSIPGVFQTFRASMDNEDYPVIMGIVIAAALLVAIGSLVVDLALAWLDPRTRTGGT